MHPPAPVQPPDCAACAAAPPAGCALRQACWPGLSCHLQGSPNGLQTGSWHHLIADRTPLSRSCMYLLSLQMSETVHRPPVPPALRPAAWLACAGAAPRPGSKGRTTAQSAAAGQLAACWWGAPRQRSRASASQRTPMSAVGRERCPQCCPHHSPAAGGQQQQVRHDSVSLQERHQTAEAGLKIKVVRVHVQQQQQVSMGVQSEPVGG